MKLQISSSNRMPAISISRKEDNSTYDSNVLKYESILLPKDYHEIFREQESVKVLGDDWRICDHEQLADKYIKKINSLFLRDTKLWLFKKACTDYVWCSNTYHGIFHKYYIVKANTSTILAGLKAPLLPLKSYVNAEEKRDVKKLLEFLHVSADIKGWNTNRLF